MKLPSDAYSSHRIPLDLFSIFYTALVIYIFLLSV